ncbi:universal stress protein [Cecembia lonarensis]|uniref:Universal stress protein UspE n=1 Tax=Cecembia lonarensis (strain CCUG 58316 / KCTC 22772 / LW9) TaxID=1225176 RepID=K1LBW2_CECL9|nr:universal stress protein [Cecembia lonarensis]EKB49707.1 universal stress protein UspE [Cecembia lonarensis LW9]
MKKILIPTDFSTCANAAENYGLQLAEKMQAEIIFLHIVITPVDWTKLTKDQENLFPETKASIASAKEKLKDLIHQAEEKGLTARKILVFNDGNEKIHKYVESEHIDLVVMGSHGTYGFREHILGSNTYGMLRRSSVPVFVVKENNPKHKLDTLVFATNFREETGESFKAAEAIAETLGAKLKVLFVNTPTYFMETNDIINIGNSYLEEFGNYTYDIEIINAFKEERGIIQFAEKIDADGIAVITSGKSDLMQYFSPSITENLIAMTELPVISIRKPKK